MSRTVPSSRQSSYGRRSDQVRGDAAVSGFESRVRSEDVASPVPRAVPPVHFPGLNGVRFFAAFAVLIYHVEVFKHFSDLPSGVAHPFWRVIGPQGVACFFTLSGFLVTYLLLEETRRTGSISVRKFYMRRILRIWPLYYLVMLMGFGAALLFAERLGFPQAVNQPLTPQLGLFALMLPNLAWVAYGTLPFASTLWSVGVEEQFYIGWAPLLRRFGQHVLVPMGATIVLLLVARLSSPWIISWLYSGAQSSGAEIGLEPSRALMIGLSFLDTFKLECMALGGLAAHVFQRGAEKPLAFLYHPATQLGTFLFVAIALAFGMDAGALDNVVWGTAYALLILNIATNPSSLVNLEHRWLDVLGRISYGIYVYHSFAVAGVLLALLWFRERTLFALSPVAFNLILYTSSIALTLAIAWISYRYYEQRFLELKPRFSVVASRADASFRRGPQGRKAPRRWKLV